MLDEVRHSAADFSQSQGFVDLQVTSFFIFWRALSNDIFISRFEDNGIDPIDTDDAVEIMVELHDRLHCFIHCFLRYTVQTDHVTAFELSIQ
jgi:hypothetical protein